jgi:uncharacterized SAM-binding protein YcdF (DUF218 family)
VFYLLSKILDVFLSPLSWVLVLCIVALRSRRRVRLGRRWAVAPLAAAILLYVFSIEPVSNALVRSLENEPRTMRDDVTYDAVVLLGGVVDDRVTATHGAPQYNENVERLLVTYDLLRADRARTTVVSGGAVDESRMDAVEARVLGKQLVDWGIAPERVVVEDRARNTRENAVEVARVARAHGWNSLVLVTSARHLPRALDCFRAVGLEVDVLPVDFRGYDPGRFSSSWLPRAQSFADSAASIREMVGRLVYRVRGFGKGP